MIFSPACMTNGLPSLWLISSVSTNPGSMIVTRMFECSASWRSASLKPVTPNFVRL